MGWDNKTTQGQASEGGNDYLQVAEGPGKRIRILLAPAVPGIPDEPFTAIQHKIERELPDGTSQMKSYVCSNAGCKLCNNRDQAPVSFRHVLPVWDYETNSVKKLAFGNKLRDQLKGLHFTSGHLSNYDVVISRTGQKRETQWFAAPVMGSTPALPPQFVPTMITFDINNLPEFAITPEEQIRTELAEMGVSFDEITRPKTYTLEEAMAYKLPFGKHKGRTLQEVFTVDTGWITWAADNVRMTDLKNMCTVIVNQLIGGNSATVSAPPAPVAPTPVPAAVTPAPVAPVAPPVQTQVVAPPPAPVQVAPAAPPVQTSATAPSASPAPSNAPVNGVAGVATREAKLKQIDDAIRSNPEFKNYTKVVEVMREVTAPTPSFDLRTYTDQQLDALLAKVSVQQ